MQNFFSGLQDSGALVSDEIQSCADVNHAVIMPGEDATDDDHETALGDLAQQLNDTSFFAGNIGMDIQLPDNLNFFSKGDDCELEFHPNGASFVEGDLLLNSSDSLRKKGKSVPAEEQDSDDKEVEELFRETSSESGQDQLESLQRGLAQGGLDGPARKRQRDVNLDDLMRASVATDLKEL